MVSVCPLHFPGHLACCCIDGRSLSDTFELNWLNDQRMLNWKENKVLTFALMSFKNNTTQGHHYIFKLSK